MSIVVHSATPPLYSPLTVQGLSGMSVPTFRGEIYNNYTRIAARGSSNHNRALPSPQESAAQGVELFVFTPER